MEGVRGTFSCCGVESVLGLAENLNGEVGRTFLDDLLRLSFCLIRGSALVSRAVGGEESLRRGGFGCPQSFGPTEWILSTRWGRSRSGIWSHHVCCCVEMSARADSVLWN